MLSTGPQPLFGALVDSWISTYDLLIRIPILSDPKVDGLRSTDPTFQRAIQNRLDLEIRDRNIEVLDLAVLPRDNWLDAIESLVRKSLRPAQLELIQETQDLNEAL